MTQSERLIKDIHFAEFRVDDVALQKYEEEFMIRFHAKADELADLGLVKFNSTKTVAEWFTAISNGRIDTSRGTGKDIYTREDYQASYPQLKVFAEMKKLEALRRHFKSFKENLSD